MDAPHDNYRTHAPASPWDLFTTFSLLTLQGFGGVLTVSQRVLCDSRRWLTPSQYIEVLAMGQVLPGSSACNLALLVGERFFGWRGAFAALAGLMAAPLVLLLALAAGYAQFVAEPAVAGALRGMGAVTAGLIVGTGLSLARELRDSPLRMPVCIATGVAAFVLIALLHWPIWASLGVIALAFPLAWLRAAHTAEAR
jgi:chromate transporter